MSNFVIPYKRLLELLACCTFCETPLCILDHIQILDCNYHRNSQILDMSLKETFNKRLEIASVVLRIVQDWRHMLAIAALFATSEMLLWTGFILWNVCGIHQNVYLPISRKRSRWVNIFSCRIVPYVLWHIGGNWQNIFMRQYCVRTGNWRENRSICR